MIVLTCFIRDAIKIWGFLDAFFLIARFQALGVHPPNIPLIQYALTEDPVRAPLEITLQGAELKWFIDSPLSGIETRFENK